MGVPAGEDGVGDPGVHEVLEQVATLLHVVVPRLVGGVDARVRGQVGTERPQELQVHQAPRG